MSEQREIKFRAWHSGKMNNDVPVYKNHWCVISRNTIGTMIMDLLEADLMQYTGLKDKNGTEIYEGDVVDYQNKSTFFRGEVAFGKVSYCVLKAPTETGFRFQSRINPNAEIEIVGNIHQNPELLTK